MCRSGESIIVVICSRLTRLRLNSSVLRKRRSKFISSMLRTSTYACPNTSLINMYQDGRRIYKCENYLFHTSDGTAYDPFDAYHWTDHPSDAYMSSRCVHGCLLLMHTLCIISAYFVSTDPCTPYDRYTLVHGWRVAFASGVPDYLPSFLGMGRTSHEPSDVVEYPLLIITVIVPCEYFVHVSYVSYSGEFSMWTFSEVEVNLYRVKVSVLWRSEMEKT